MVSKNLETINVAVTALRAAHTSVNRAYRVLMPCESIEAIDFAERTAIGAMLTNLADVSYSMIDLIQRLDGEAIRLDELEG